MGQNGESDTEKTFREIKKKLERSQDNIDKANEKIGKIIQEEQGVDTNRDPDRGGHTTREQ